MSTGTATRKAAKGTAAARGKAAAGKHDARAPNAAKEIARATPMDVARELVDRHAEMVGGAGWGTLSASQRQSLARIVRRSWPDPG